MSWLFGWGRGSGSQPPEEQLGSAGGADGAGGAAGAGGDKPGDKWSNFDPTGLERAAKAARELDKSRVCIIYLCVFNTVTCFLPSPLSFASGAEFVLRSSQTLSCRDALFFSPLAPTPHKMFSEQSCTLWTTCCSNVSAIFTANLHPSRHIWTERLQMKP